MLFRHEEIFKRKHSRITRDTEVTHQDTMNMTTKPNVIINVNVNEVHYGSVGYCSNKLSRLSDMFWQE